ncbi:MAG: PilZ domain-containing protein [Spirochaetales bacterium]|nr:PilZ domain-containing protein [Spirochaetales bacterium]
MQKDLPVSICPLDDNPEGVRYQGLLKSIDSDHILVYSPHAKALHLANRVSLEFRIDRNDFRLTTSILNLAPKDQLLLRKPKQIHKKQIREGQRLSYSLPVKYTLWTKTGRHEAELRDLSDQGLRMVGNQPLRKNSLVSLDFYIKDAKTRVITQGMVIWSRKDEENEHLIESGIHFTTISNEARKKIARFVAERAPFEEEDEDEDA